MLPFTKLMSSEAKAGGKTTKICCGTVVLRRADVMLPSAGSETCHAVYIGDDPKRLKAAGPVGCYAKDSSGEDFVMMRGDPVTICCRPVTEITDWKTGTKTGTYPKRQCEELVLVHFRYKQTQSVDDAKCMCGVCGEYEWLDPPPGCECDKTKEYCRNNQCAIM